MNRFIFVVALTGVSLLAQPKPRPPTWQADAATAQELTGIEHQWAEALVQGDASLIADRMAPEFMLVAPWGKSSRDEDLHGGSFGGPWKCTFCTFKPVEVRVYGQTAMVQGIYDQKANFAGKPADGHGLYLDLFVKRDGKWLVVYAQFTPTLN